MNRPEAIACVIDDEPDVRRALRWLLEPVGISVREFASVAEFLERPRPEGLGCIVLDVRMPGMSGAEFLERMGSFGIELPVVVLTGHGTIAMATRALRAGAVDFVEKPINEQLLIDRVQQAIERSRSAHARKAMAARLASLSAREAEIVKLVCAGCHSKEIARDLRLSPRTIEAHRTQAMKKLGVHGIAELVALALHREE